MPSDSHAERYPATTTDDPHDCFVVGERLGIRHPGAEVVLAFTDNHSEIEKHPDSIYVYHDNDNRVDSIEYTYNKNDTVQNEHVVAALSADYPGYEITAFLDHPLTFWTQDYCYRRIRVIYNDIGNVVKVKFG